MSLMEQSAVHAYTAFVFDYLVFFFLPIKCAFIRSESLIKEVLSSENISCLYSVGSIVDWNYICSTTKLMMLTVGASYSLNIRRHITIMNNQRQLSKVSIHDLSSRFKSKREMHTFLSNDGHAYLPKLESVNFEFMKAVLTGRKEVSI